MHTAIGHSPPVRHDGAAITYLARQTLTYDAWRTNHEACVWKPTHTVNTDVTRPKHGCAMMVAGDAIHAQNLLGCYRRRQPDPHLHYLCPSASRAGSVPTLDRK